MVLRQSSQAFLGDPDVLEIIAKLERCGRAHSGKYSQGGQRRPGRYHCGLRCCPACQTSKSGKAKARSVALVVAATNATPDHDEVFLATIDAPKGQSLKEFRTKLTRAQRVLGFKCTGWFHVGLTGNLHCHVSMIYAQGRHDLWGRLRDLKLFPHVCLETFEQAYVLEGVEETTGYGVDPIHGRDADSPGSRELWTPEGITNWVVAMERHKGLRKLELGFTRSERANARTWSIKGKSKKKAERKSILLTKLRQDRFNVFVESKKAPVVLNSRSANGVDHDQTGTWVSSGAVRNGDLDTTDSRSGDEVLRKVGENIPVHHVVSQRGGERRPKLSSLRVRMARLLRSPLSGSEGFTDSKSAAKPEERYC
jgi:hypothetical protein